MPVGNSLLMLAVIQTIWRWLGNGVDASLLLAFVVAGCGYLLLLLPTGQFAALTGRAGVKRRKK